MRADVAAIARRLAAATPGPWLTSPLEVNAALVSAREGPVCSAFTADATLIANAPADMRALLDEVAELRNLITTTRESAQRIVDMEAGDNGHHPSWDVADDIIERIDMVLS